jgi:hypothetical protein
MFLPNILVHLLIDIGANVGDTIAMIKSVIDDPCDRY